MLINELPFAKKQELARKLRKLIEPDKAQTRRIIKEAEIRRFLSKDHLTYYGLSDLISVMKSNYSEKNISRLVSKIQKSIVWDTCLCNLSSPEITDLLFNSNYENIITRTVYDELLKLVISKDADPKSSENAFRLVTNILDDTDSKYCSIIDLPPKIINDTYVDNQLLKYCKINNYELYTHDYVLGLRAKSRHISVKIFSRFEKNDIEQYTPTSSGKNMILDCSLLNNVSLSDILITAKSLKGNQFVLTPKFIESLESIPVKRNNKDLINFLINDSDNIYTLYPEEATSDLVELAKKCDAIVLTSSIEQCITYRNYFIPYKIVYPSDVLSFKKNILKTLKSSPYCYSINYSEDDLVEKSEDNSNNDSTSTSEATQEISSTEIPVSQRYQLSVPPHMNPQTNEVNLKKLALTERMWILNETGTDLSAKLKSKIQLHVDYTVVHIEKLSQTTYELDVYKIVNQKAKCGLKTVSLSFDKNFIETCVPQEYKVFARVATKLS